MILLTGATGYVGRRLLTALEARGHQIRCLVRRPDSFSGARIASTEIEKGDVFDDASLQNALQGVKTAYYLIHAMDAGGSFAERDRDAARSFARAAEEAGVGRIIYLGGLGNENELSDHLASRQEVGRVLGEAGVPVVELRASIIIGAGSVSFEIVRSLVDKLPIMITPRWVRTPAQPISIEDVVSYLVEALERDLPLGGIFEIGGAEQISYGGLMKEYARQRGLRRILLPVPVLSPGLSGLWLSLVAPRHARVGRALIEGVRNETVVKDPAALQTFSVRPCGVGEAVKRALAELPAERPALAGAASLGALIVCLLGSLAAGVIGSALSANATGKWYASLAKPSFTPPAWVFGPIWTVLFIMMGVAAWRVWRHDGLRESRLALGIFAFQLIVNAAWSGLFFGLRSPGVAVLDILLLDAAVAATILFFSARNGLAAWLLAPYAGWLLYATVLNVSIWQMNTP